MSNVSIVLSAYNGSQYIKEQLDSLRDQARCIDQVLICDDCSTDKTVPLVKEFINDNNLTNWSLCQNTTNQGWKKNFRNLLINASGDYVFPCDQDDIWLPEKVESMVSVMERHPEIDVLACSVDPFYELGSQKSNAANTEAEDGGELLVPQGIDEKAIYIQRPGCSFCVRKSFIDEIELYWPDDWAHDVILWTLSEVKGSLYLYNRRLMRFRRHAGNASARKKITRLSRIEDLSYQIDKVQRMKRFGDEQGYLTEEKRQSLEGTCAWLEARRAYLNSGSLAALTKILVGRDYYRSSKGLPVDLFLGIFKNASV